MTTHVYLDVDGVINAVTLADQPAWGWSTPLARVAVDGWPITYSPDLVDALNDLAARDDVVIYWLTTWNTRAAELLAPALGINGTTWEVLGREDQYSSEHRLHWWKLPAIRRHVESTKPDVAVWIDDDISFDAEAIAWAATVEHLLTISPRTDRGLTAAEFDLVRRACEASA